LLDLLALVVVLNWVLRVDVPPLPQSFEYYARLYYARHEDVIDFCISKAIVTAKKGAARTGGHTIGV
jgi:hypothetical protein